MWGWDFFFWLRILFSIISLEVDKLSLKYYVKKLVEVLKKEMEIGLSREVVFNF